MTKGIDQLVPVDVFVPGCPPPPEALTDALDTLPAGCRREAGRAGGLARQRSRRRGRDGYRFFDWLGVEDLVGRQDALLVVLALRRLDRPADVLLLGTELDRAAPRLDSIRRLFAGAAWHEREAAELFGVEFVGGGPAPAAAGRRVHRHAAAQGRGAGGAYGAGLAGGEGAGGERPAP